MAAEIWQWITPEGQAFRLDSNVDGVYISRTAGTVEGRFMPPIRRTADDVPLQPGTRTRSVLHDESEVVLPLHFPGTDPTNLRANLRTWMARLDPTRGDGKLRITDPAGAVRELTCSYHDGLGLIEKGTWRQDQLAVVTFVAADPYWADASDSTQQWTGGTPPTFFPIFPLKLGQSQTFGISTVTNVGDVSTYPVWTIDGPGSLLVLTNRRTGRILAWNGTLGAGERLTIDCRPGSQSGVPKSVKKQDGSNQFGFLSAWDFWPLEPGANEIQIEMASTSGASKVTASWRARYLGA